MGVAEKVLYKLHEVMQTRPEVLFGGLMPEFEKIAWWNLSITVGAVVGFLALWVATHRPDGAMAAFSLLALSALPYFRRRQPLCDERDREIDRRSSLIAMGVFWAVLVLGLVGAGVALGWDAVVEVPVVAFSSVIWGGWVVIQGVKAVASIRMYRAG